VKTAIKSQSARNPLSDGVVGVKINCLAFAARALFGGVLLAGLLLASRAGAVNLLQDGDFNAPSLSPAWTTWTYGGGWIGTSTTASQEYDGTPFAYMGADSGGGAGLYQILSAAPATSYTVSCVSGVQNWWWPAAEMRMFFLDANGTQLVENVTNCAAAITANDTGLGWSNYTMTAISPAGTAQVKIEFACPAGDGTVWFDNASLTTPLVYPTIGNLVPSGNSLFQPVGALSFTAASTTTTINNSGIQVIINGADVSSNLVITGSALSKNVSYSVTSNQFYVVSIKVTDANGLDATTAFNFDTFSSSYYTWEAEDWDFNGGQFYDNPQIDKYSGLTNSIFDVDYLETSTGTNAATWLYRPWVNGAIPVPETEVTADVERSQYATAAAIDYDVGWFDGGEWLNYTRTFPTGLYNVYARISSPGASTMNLAEVTAGLGTTNQTTESLGNFSLVNGQGWTTFLWVPLTDASGNLVKLNLGGVSTLRVTSGGNANANFFMLVPANTNLPVISGIYPDGSVQFQATNKLSFSVSSADGVNPGSIRVTLNVTNLTTHYSTNITSANGLAVGGTANNLTVSYAGLITNANYSVVISVTDVNNNSVTINPHFDTFNPVLTWEAEDWDYNGGEFIDNPPVDGYAGLHGLEGIDFHDINGLGNRPYRPLDAMSADVIQEVPRKQYVVANTNDYAVGYFITNEWINYTRTFPAGTYNIYGRFAAGGGASTLSLGVVTNGVGTSSQSIEPLGTFNVATTGGWGTYAFTPLVDQFGNVAQVTLNGKTTLQLERTGGADANVNFFMLLPAVTTLPTITQVGPLGWVQSTNLLQFVASSASGIAGSNVVVTLNGVVTTNLVFTGSATSWAVGCTLAPNTIYTAVITVTDNHGLVTTTSVSLDTFNLNNYTWEAEDYDYNGGMFIDNPQVDGYFGVTGISGIDYLKVSTGGTPDYRPDPVDTEYCGDTPRPQFAGGYLDYEVGYTGTGDWWNYTRTYPTGQFNVYLRAARGTAGTAPMGLQKVTSGWGTTSQTTVKLGNFSVPETAGWQVYTWVPLTDSTGRLVVVPLGGQATLRLTDGGANLNFMMLTPAVALAATPSGKSMNLSFGTQSGFNYTVLYKNKLTDTTWTPISTATGDGTVKAVTDTMTAGSRYYILEAH
jgi:hypothetical protein